TPSAISGYKTPGTIDPIDDDTYNNSVIEKTPGYKTPGEQYDPAYKTPGYKTPGFKTPGYKTPGYKTPGQSAFSFKEETVSYQPATSQYHGTLVKINDQEKTVKDIIFNEDKSDIVILTNDESHEIDNVKFVTPEQFNKVVIFKGKYKGHIGMLLRLKDNDIGIVRSTTLGAIEVELNLMSKISN
ncbi:Transcription factor SPT5, partial [Pseudoloma neurophilia]